MLNENEIKDIESLIKKLAKRASTEELLYFVITETEIFNTLKDIYINSREKNEENIKLITSIVKKNGLIYGYFEAEILKILTIFNPLSDKSDLYSKMELQQGATKEDVKKKFRELSLKYHPDLVGSEHTAKFIEICQAYNIILEDIDNLNTNNNTSQPWLYKQEDFVFSKNNNRMPSRDLMVIFCSVIMLIFISIFLINYYNKKTFESRIASSNLNNKKTELTALISENTNTSEIPELIASNIEKSDFETKKEKKEKNLSNKSEKNDNNIKISEKYDDKLNKSSLKSDEKSKEIVKSDINHDKIKKESNNQEFNDIKTKDAKKSANLENTYNSKSSDFSESQNNSSQNKYVDKTKENKNIISDNNKLNQIEITENKKDSKIEVKNNGQIKLSSATIEKIVPEPSDKLFNTTSNPIINIVKSDTNKSDKFDDLNTYEGDYLNNITNNEQKVLSLSKSVNQNKELNTTLSDASKNNEKIFSENISVSDKINNDLADKNQKVNSKENIVVAKLSEKNKSEKEATKLPETDLLKSSTPEKQIKKDLSENIPPTDFASHPEKPRPDDNLLKKSIENIEQSDKPALPADRSSTEEKKSPDSTEITNMDSSQNKKEVKSVEKSIKKQTIQEKTENLDLNPYDNLLKKSIENIEQSDKPALPADRSSTEEKKSPDSTDIMNMDSSQNKKEVKSVEKSIKKQTIQEKTENFDLNPLIDKFINKYISTYQEKSFVNFAKLFTARATENGKSFHEKKEQYYNLFSSIESLTFSIFDYSLITEDKKIVVIGLFKTNMIFKDSTSKKFTGKIYLTIVKNNDSFLVEDLSYKFDI